MPVETMPTTMPATISAASPASTDSIRSNLVVFMLPSRMFIDIDITISKDLPRQARLGGRMAQAFDEKGQDVGLGDAQPVAIAVGDGIAQRLEDEQARQQGSAVGDGPAARLERRRHA